MVADAAVAGGRDLLDGARVLRQAATGTAAPSATGVQRDALHNKGLLHYDGTPKPAFFEARKDFARTPLYPDG